jgi:hypothetical protein
MLELLTAWSQPDVIRPLAAAVITLGILGRDRPGSRPSGAAACWLAVALAAGWFAFCLMAAQK